MHYCKEKWPTSNVKANKVTSDSLNESMEEMKSVGLHHSPKFRNFHNFNTQRYLIVFNCEFSVCMHKIQQQEQCNSVLTNPDKVLLIMSYAAYERSTYVRTLYNNLSL